MTQIKKNTEKLKKHKTRKKYDFFDKIIKKKKKMEIFAF
jgi:hypothetical protein